MSPHPIVPHDLIKVVSNPLLTISLDSLQELVLHLSICLQIQLKLIKISQAHILQFKKRMRNYNEDQSSESDVDLDDNAYKATTGYGKIAKMVKNQHKYGSSSSSQQSITSQEEQQQPSPNTRSPKKQTYKAPSYGHQSDSEEDESDRGIDHIEQRIKQLENDLEKKIDKHKQESTAVKPNQPTKSLSSEKNNHLKNNGSPPLPRKIQPKSVSAVFKPQTQPKNPKPALKQHKQIEQEQKEERWAAPKKQSKHLPQIVQQKRQAKESPTKKKHKQKKQSQQHKNPNMDKKRAESKPNPKVQMNQETQAAYIKKLNKANKHIQDLTKTLEQTRKENKRLKEQLQSKKNKKSNVQVQKLKEINSLTENAGQVKLEKEIQLLKIIQHLQVKLKKSINKKLTKSRVGSTSAALLHKGLPSSLLH